MSSNIHQSGFYLFFFIILLCDSVSCKVCVVLTLFEWKWVWNTDEMILTRKYWIYGRKTCQMPHCPSCVICYVYNKNWVVKLCSVAFLWEFALQPAVQVVEYFQDQNRIAGRRQREWKNKEPMDRGLQIIRLGPKRVISRVSRNGWVFHFISLWYMCFCMQITGNFVSLRNAFSLEFI